MSSNFNSVGGAASQHYRTQGNVSSMLSDELVEVQAYSSCSIYCLKQLIARQVPSMPVSDQVISYMGHTMDNHLTLGHYKIAHSP
jgi:hypothetical protein